MKITLKPYRTQKLYGTNNEHAWLFEAKVNISASSQILFDSQPTKSILGSLHGNSALIPVVRTAQFDTILNEPPVIITQMRVNTCLP